MGRPSRARSQGVSLQTLLAYGALLVVVGYFGRVLVHEAGHAIAVILVTGGETSHVLMQVGLFSGWAAWRGALAIPQHVIVSLAGSLTVLLVAFGMTMVPVRSVWGRKFLRFTAVLWGASEVYNMAPLNNTDGNWLSSVWGDHVQAAIAFGVVVTTVYLGFLATHPEERLSIRL